VDPDPPVRGDLGPGENIVDPRIADSIADYAREELGDRFVDLWTAEDLSSLVLGVHSPKTDDWELLDVLDNSPLITIYECPVSRGALEAAGHQAAEFVGDKLIGGGLDFVNGRVELGVSFDQVDLVVDQINGGGSGLLAVAEGEPAPESKLGQIVVIVEPDEDAVPDEDLDPPETKSEGPLRAGKKIFSAHDGGTFGCTANALVKAGTARYVLTNGHCGAVGESVFYPGPTDWVGRYTISTWYSSANNGLILGDIGMFPAPMNAEASIFVRPGFARSITGWAEAKLGDPVCIRGQKTDKEMCGKVTRGWRYAPQSVFREETGRRLVFGFKMTDIETQSGDSGAPVYSKLANGDAIIVGIHSTKGEYFSPFGQALSVTRTDLVTSGSVRKMLSEEDLSPSFDQIVLSGDVTGNGRGEILAVDQAGLLSLHETKANGGPKRPPYFDGMGFKYHKVYAPGNWDKTGRADVVTTTVDGKMWLFPRDREGVLGKKRQIGQGWGGYTIIPVGDVNGDGNPDLLAIRNSTGDLYLYAGDGRGGFKFPYPKVGYGWKGYELFAAGDLDNDGKADILSIDKAGDLWFYKGKGDGTFHKKVQVGNSWHGYKLAAGADLDGDGLADIVGRDSAGRLYFTRQRVPGASRRRCWSEQDGEDSVEQ